MRGSPDKGSVTWPHVVLGPLGPDRLGLGCLGFGPGLVVLDVDPAHLPPPCLGAGVLLEPSARVAGDPDIQQPALGVVEAVQRGWPDAHDEIIQHGCDSRIVRSVYPEATR